MKNRLWGTERIRGELLKLGIRVCKRTIQKYIRQVRTPQPKGQKWATFLRNHVAQIWACDVLSGDGSLLSTAFRVRYHRTQIEARDPRGSDTISIPGLHNSLEKPRRMWHTSIGHDRIKVFNSRFPMHMDHLVSPQTRVPKYGQSYHKHTSFPAHKQRLTPQRVLRWICFSIHFLQLPTLIR